MKQKCLLVYNPKAGHGRHDEEKIVERIKKAGYKCEAVSIKDRKWKKIPPGIDFIAVAGGDGTVNRVMNRVQERKKGERAWPIAILPLGTANNIATSVGCIGKPAELIKSWGQNSTTFNTGIISYGEDTVRFFEAAGVGLFAKHLRDIKKVKEITGSPAEKLAAVRKTFLTTLAGCRAKKYEIETDAGIVNGEYLMVEIMNTPLMGPSLRFIREVEHGDGLLDLVLYSEADRRVLQEYFESDGGEGEPVLVPDKMRIKWAIIKTKGDFHVDDVLVKSDGSAPVYITTDDEALTLLVPPAH